MKYKINKIEIKEEHTGKCRGNKVDLEYLFSLDIDLSKGPLEIGDIEHQLKQVKHPKFNNYEGLLFVFNGKDIYKVSPHHVALGEIRLIHHIKKITEK